MTAAMYSLMRHHDVTGISGEGHVGTVVEFDDGHTVLHWDTATPSTTVYTDIRHITALHGHEGASTLEPLDSARLLAAYQRVVPWMLSARYHDRPLTCAPHPDHPDRLRCVFRDERPWRFWISLLDGSSHAAVHEEVNGETEHRWISADGNVWLIYYTPISGDDPLETFDKEDR